MLLTILFTHILPYSKDKTTFKCPKFYIQLNEKINNKDRTRRLKKMKKKLTLVWNENEKFLSLSPTFF